jgi:hypothetical protein
MNGAWLMNRIPACASRGRSRRAYAIGAGLLVAVQTRTANASFTLGSVRWALREGERLPPRAYSCLPAKRETPSRVKPWKQGETARRLAAGLPATGSSRIQRTGQRGRTRRHLQARAQHRGHDGSEVQAAEAVPRARSRRRVRALQLLRLNPVRREHHAELRAPAWLAFDLQRRLMPLQHMLDDGQAESGAAGVP